MPPRDTALQNAIVAHRAGRLTEAEVGYSRVLRKSPPAVDPADRAAALYGLGLLRFHQGEAATAIAHLTQSLELAPANARAWNDLGGMLMAAGRISQATAAYRRSTEVAPDNAEGWYNLAVCLRKEGDVDGAVSHFREAIAHQPDYSRAREALAALLYQSGRTQEAAAAYDDWARHEPTNPKARHLAAAASEHNVPDRASDEYVRELFDSSAKGFDNNLRQLSYRAPDLVADALVRAVSAPLFANPQHHAAHQADLGASPRLTVLDAGCGTGLCGPRIRPLCNTLVGVDLSPAMVEHARTRGCYDNLTVAEITAFMRSHLNTYDAIIAADTLVYFGPLELPLTAARAALRPSGLLVFTLEACSSDTTPISNHRLELHGRYTHTEQYARQVIAVTGFELESITRETLRQERLQAVTGYVVTARRGAL